MNKFIIFVLPFLILACTHLQYPEIPEYKLSRSDAFIISESPGLWKFFERSMSKNPNLEVHAGFMPHIQLIGAMQESPLATSVENTLLDSPCLQNTTRILIQM